MIRTIKQEKRRYVKETITPELENDLMTFLAAYLVENVTKENIKEYLTNNDISFDENNIDELFQIVEDVEVVRVK